MASWSTGRMLSSLSPPVKVLMLFWKMDYLSWFCVESKALELSVPEEGGWGSILQVERRHGLALVMMVGNIGSLVKEWSRKW